MRDVLKEILPHGGANNSRIQFTKRHPPIELLMPDFAV